MALTLDDLRHKRGDAFKAAASVNFQEGPETRAWRKWNRLYLRAKRARIGPCETSPKSSSASLAP